MEKKTIYSRQSSNKFLISESKKCDNQNKPLRRNTKQRENSNNNSFKNDQRFYKKNNKNRSKKFKPRASVNSDGTPNNVLEESFSSSGLENIYKNMADKDDDSEINKRNTHDGSVSDMNSIFLSRSKKQNLNHLLNFHYVSYETSSVEIGLNIVGKSSNNNGSYLKRQKYNKEQYLQANFQFVIRESVKSLVDLSNPDTLIDWNLIEQINIQTTEEPQCPICLYPPIAAKLTRCGHIYCWPCILHYLALSEKTWRRCPICYEAIYVKDLKSTSIVQQKNFKTGDKILFHLMHRKKDSIIAKKCSNSDVGSGGDDIPCMDDNVKKNPFSKFLIVDFNAIMQIIKREQLELESENSTDCAESIFIQQSLELLKERKLFIAQEQGLNLDQLDKLSISSNNKDELFTFKISSIQIKDHIKENFSNGNQFGINNSDGAIKKEIFYYFYQSIDGQNIFLHPLNVKMLQTMYGTLKFGPKILEANILQKEYYTMDEYIRKKFTCLGYLPLTCQFEVVEVQLQEPTISKYVLQKFESDISARQNARILRDREENKREKQINDFNDRQMGKFISKLVNIDIGSPQQFPTCGFEESLNCKTTDNLKVKSHDVDVTDTLANLCLRPNRKIKSTSFATILSLPKKELWPKLGSNNSIQNLAVSNKIVPIRSNILPTGCKSSNLEVEVSNEVATVHLSNNLSDVLAEALELKKQRDQLENSTVNSCKKGKKGKKTLLYSTDMNFGGN